MTILIFIIFICIIALMLSCHIVYRDLDDYEKTFDRLDNWKFIKK